MGEKEKEYEKLFIEAVDEGLGTLGESGKHMVFFHLDTRYSVKRHEIPKKPEAFARGLEKIFGAGASVLEKIIVKSLYSKSGLECEDVESRPFVDYVNHVREANDAEETRQDERGGGSSSNQRSREAKSFQQSSLLCVETDVKNGGHFYR